MNKRKAAGRICSSVSSSWKVLRFVAPQPSAVPVGGLHAVPVRSHDRDNDISARLQRHESRRLPKRRGLQCYFGFHAQFDFMLRIVAPPRKIPDGRLRCVELCCLFLPLAKRTRLGRGFFLALLRIRHPLLALFFSFLLRQL